jgi:Kae1-associated kinase Bud32
MQGAEAIIERTEGGVLKSRPAKKYRHEQLDTELRLSRTKHEARILERARTAGVPVPTVKQLDDTTLLLEEIPGVQLREALDSNPSIAHQLGRLVAKLHGAHIIHGDLTTSNMLWDGNKLTIIDFGLSFSSIRAEDMAVDLHLLHQSLQSKHHRVLAAAWRHVLAGYREHGQEEVITQLRKVEARGRNKGS